MSADMENQNQGRSSRLLHVELTEKIIGIYYDVYNEVGHGFLESVYGNCMHRALTQAGLSVEREVSIPVFFLKETCAAFLLYYASAKRLKLRNG